MVLLVLIIYNLLSILNTININIDFIINVRCVVLLYHAGQVAEVLLLIPHHYIITSGHGLYYEIKKLYEFVVNVFFYD